MASPMMARACGRRKKGGIYSECPLGEGGTPIEDFLFDPPAPLNIDLAPQGVKLFERDGIWHLVDWVGSSHYPNVADFVEEVRRMGMSRRLPKATSFERLTPESMHFLVHARAIVAHPEMYRPPHVHPDTDDTTGRGPYQCPKNITPHAAGVEVGESLRHPMCAGIWWEDLDPFDTFVEPDVAGSRVVTRKIPSGTYEGLCSPGEPRQREYIPGYFGAFPIWNLLVIRDPEHGTHEAALEAAARAGLDVELADE